MPRDEIRAIELARLHELEKQSAALGPSTPPHILIEIQALHTKYPGTPRNGVRVGAFERTTAQSELDFVMNTVAAALQRITAMEQRQESAETDRAALSRQLDQVLYRISDLHRWVKFGGIGIAVALAIGLVLAVVVF